MDKWLQKSNSNHEKISKNPAPLVPPTELSYSLTRSFSRTDPGTATMIELCQSEMLSFEHPGPISLLGDTNWSDIPEKYLVVKAPDY